eukprot:1359781-Amorphochlora_amoeboformis.AAC.1
MPPTFEESKSILERPLFKEPIGELSEDLKEKRRELTLKAFKMTLDQVWNIDIPLAEINTGDDVL